jgi:hypothetical protein
MRGDQASLLLHDEDILFVDQVKPSIPLGSSSSLVTVALSRYGIMT